VISAADRLVGAAAGGGEREPADDRHQQRDPIVAARWFRRFSSNRYRNRAVGHLHRWIHCWIQPRCPQVVCVAFGSSGG